MPGGHRLIQSPTNVASLSDKAAIRMHLNWFVNGVGKTGGARALAALQWTHAPNLTVQRGAMIRRDVAQPRWFV